MGKTTSKNWYLLAVEENVWLSTICCCNIGKTILRLTNWFRKDRSFSSYCLENLNVSPCKAELTLLWGSFVFYWWILSWKCFLKLYLFVFIDYLWTSNNTADWVLFIASCNPWVNEWTVIFSASVLWSSSSNWVLHEIIPSRTEFWVSQTDWQNKMSMKKRTYTTLMEVLKTGS